MVISSEDAGVAGGEEARALGELSERQLSALLDDEGGGGSAGAGDAEQWVRRLAERLARLDALNVSAMLAAATDGGGAQLATSLDRGGAAGAALRTRLDRYESLTRGADGAVHGGAGGAGGVGELNARRLLAALEQLFAWLDAPALDRAPPQDAALATPEGRARALQAATALRAVLRAPPPASDAGAALQRLGATRERVKRLQRARERLAASFARHLNNLLIHLGNEAAAGEGAAAGTGAGMGAGAHHAELLQYAPLMRWLKDMDEKAFEALSRVYVSCWSRVHERVLRAAVEGARTQLAAAPPTDHDQILEQVLRLVEDMCNAEQDFCTQFFLLDVDVKADCSDGDRSERSAGSGGARRAGGAAGGAGSEARRMLAELFPNIEQELVALVAIMEKHDTYGAMRALACTGRRVVGASEAGAGAGGAAASGGEGRWARAALAAAAVAAKRGADRAVSERVAAFPDAVKAAAKRNKCGLLPFVAELERLHAACEAIFAGSARRADVERWYGSVVSAALHAIEHASHPRTPPHVIHLENYHRLHGALSALRVASLEGARREARARYTAALRAYVTQYFGRPLDKLNHFFEGVAEAVGGGAPEHEVCYRAAFSKQELRRVLQLYPPHEVRKSLHRLYRTVEKHVSEESGLLQVVWRHMQEEFIAQHQALQTRLTASYAGSGLALPLSTQDILDAFSDIAREH